MRGCNIADRFGVACGKLEQGKQDGESKDASVHNHGVGFLFSFKYTTSSGNNDCSVDSININRLSDKVLSSTVSGGRFRAARATAFAFSIPLKFVSNDLRSCRLK